MTESRTPLEMLYHWEKAAPDRTYLRQPLHGEWIEFSWRRAADEARRIAQALRALNLPPGSPIALASKNCAHWLLADYAIWMAGHVSVPLYPNLTTATARQILEHCEAKAIFLGKLDAFAAYADAIPRPMPTFTFPYAVPAEYRQWPGWDDLVKNNAPIADSPARRNDEVATIIYTSGTTGVPKGVVHRFASFTTAGVHILPLVKLGPSDKFFSYLPLAHVAERVFTETMALYGGAQVAFVESLDTFAKNLADEQPTMFLGVPRIWEKFRQGILGKVPAEKLDRLLGLPIVGALVRRKIKKGLGLAKARICVTGAAAIAPELLAFFERLGIRIQEAYGLTENLAYSHFNRSENVKPGTVGQPWPGVEVRLGENDEVQMRCPALMDGYYKEPAMTREMIRDGWLCTGDQGEIDADGFLKLTGRVKELFKTAKGKYVAPTPIEMKLAAEPVLEHACVLGSGRVAAMAIVTLSELGRQETEAALMPKLRSLLATVNAGLDPHERLGKLVVVDDQWTVENEFLTPTMKLRRRLVEKKFGEMLSAWEAARGEDVLFAGK